MMALFWTAGYAVTAKITDVSGRTYDITSVKLTKGSKFKVVCGGVRMEVPLKSVSEIRINGARISSVGGRPHYGVEIKMSDGTVVGGGDGGVESCLLCADNGFRGKVSKKAVYSASFGDISSVEILGKEDKKQAGQGQGEGEDADDGEE